MATGTVLLFDDRSSSDLSGWSQLHSFAKSRPNLKQFLEDASNVLHAELEHVLPRERRGYEKFADILDLVKQHEACSHMNEAVGIALTTIIQVAELIVFAENRPEILGANSRTHQIGVSVGLIAAAVAVAANNAIEVVQLGLQGVAISFRLGIALWRRTRLIEDNSHESWGCTITGMHPNEIEAGLKALNESLPPHKRAYIGVQTETWSTLFAPPSTMRNLLVSTHFGQTPQSRLPSGIAIHASHLPSLAVESIVGNDSSLDIQVPPGVLFSSSTCRPYATSDLRGLLHLIVGDISQKPLYLEAMIEKVASSLKAHDTTSIELVPVGSTHCVSITQRGLQRGGVEIADIHDTLLMDTLQDDASNESNHVAIVGMSGRFPDCESIDDLWTLLQAGKTTHQRIPASRFISEDFFDATLKAPMATSTEVGCFLRHPGEFDNLLFNISPREALQMDPVQRLLLMTTYEALQMAGYSQHAIESALQSRIASFIGQMSDDWKNINDQQGVDTHYIPGTMRAFAPGRLNHFYHFGGGITSVDTGCSASATAVHLACKALLSREVDTAIAGGANLTTTPDLYSGLCKGGFLSSGPCKTFSDEADGYCRGEAVGVVVLKRKEDAIRDNDNILAVIRGTARNSNAGTGSNTIAFPSSNAQVSLYQRLLHDSDTRADEISFIEMHGTATQAGDAAEMSAVLRMFANTRSSTYPLHVGALKAAIGHAEAAAGISGLIKAVLMLQKRAMPPQPDWPFKLNPTFGSLENAHVKISDGLSPLTASMTGNGRCKVIVNNFDAAGGNVSMLLEEAPKRERANENIPGGHHVVAVSGRTSEALAANEARLKDFLCVHPDILLASLAYTTTARRTHELHRSAHAVQSISELIDKLDSSQVKQPPAIRSSGRQLIFTFTGQGSEYTAQGKELYQTSPLFKSILDSYQHICDCQGLSRFLDIITGSKDVSEASPSQLQLSIVALEVAIAQFVEGLGLRPTAVIGHSLGEYAALCVAGVLSVADMLYLVHIRASMVAKYCKAGSFSMLALAASVDTVKTLLDMYGPELATCEIACLNAPDMTVVSGNAKEIAALQSRLTGQDFQTTVLPILYGFHSSQMEPILDEFEQAAQAVLFNSPSIPVASSLLGEVVRSPGIFDALYLRRQMREPVDFYGAAKALEEEAPMTDNAVAVEIGPSPVCISLLTKCCPGAQIKTLASLRKGEDSWKSMSRLLADLHVAGLSILWPELYKPFKSSLRLLDLPSYAFDSKDYWVPYKTKKNDRTLSTSEQRSVSPFSNGAQLPYVCVQMLDSLNVTDTGGVKAVYSSTLTQDCGLFDAIRGHAVNGVSLCPASVFVEMAHTATTHVLSSTGVPRGSPHLQVMDLQMFHPLLLPGKAQDTIVRITAEMEPSAKYMSISFIAKTGTKTTTHGTCKVCFGPETSETLPQWPHLEKLVRARFATLRDSAKTGPTHRMSKSLFYQLFGELVKYEERFQLIQEAYVSADFQDAAAVCSVGDDPTAGYFTCGPFTTDGFMHLSGFILNASLAKDTDIIYIANCIGHTQLLKSLSTKIQYKCYATIRERTDKGAICDVYVFDEEDLVAVCTDISFQRMSRQVFSLMVGQIDTSKAAQARSRQDPEAMTSAQKAQFGSQRTGKVTVPVERSDARRSPHAPKLSQVLFDLVAAELGMLPEDLSRIGRFDSAGLDSMMSIKVVSLFKEKTNIELPGAFFQNHPTTSEVEAELDAAAPNESDGSSSHTSDSFVAVAAPSEVMARAVLIQGDPQSNKRPVFLLTDGRGSVDAFVHLAPLPDGQRLFALESPFVDDPAALLTHSIPQLAQLYIRTIRTMQSRGPYILVGRSSGGAYAYEVAYQLSHPPHNEIISGLIIVDMRVPRAVPHASGIDMDFVAKAWHVIVERTKVLDNPDDLAHSAGTIRALYSYEPVPFPARERPKKNYIIWAKLGVNDSPNGWLRDDGVEGVAAMGPPLHGSRDLESVTMDEFEADFKSWFWAKREDFGVHEWNTLLGDRCKTMVVEGDHFTMMLPPYSESLSAALIEAVQEIEHLEQCGEIGGAE